MNLVQTKKMKRIVQKRHKKNRQKSREKTHKRNIVPHLIMKTKRKKR